MSDFAVRLDSDDLIFSAAHFITFEDGACEALHGHDFRLAVEVPGPLNLQQYVVDFVILHEVLKGVVTELDHRVLLPRNHSRINIQTFDNDLEISLGGRRWALPKVDCLLLPVANTTCEILAQYLAQRIYQELANRKIALPKQIRVELSEGGGYTAICHFRSDE